LNFLKILKDLDVDQALQQIFSMTYGNLVDLECHLRQCWN